MKRLSLRCAALAFLVSCQSAAASAAPAAKACSSPAVRAEVSATIRAFFAALAVDDDAKLRRLTTPDFYAFEVGKRFTGPELFKLIAETHKSGRTIQWNIGEVDARTDCRLAFAAWENVGAAGPAGKLEPRSWLESAMLVRQGGRWAIAFLHSTPKDPRK